jgi:hypothetical protein
LAPWFQLYEERHEWVCRTRVAATPTPMAMELMTTL